MGVLEEIRRIPSNVPFVLMSAHATPEEVAKAKGLGATGFLAKPFTPDQLKELVATV
jgi:DNA-binding NtrC family response regulator